MAVPAQNGQPAFVAQNMDLENYTDGFQVIMQINGSFSDGDSDSGSEPDQLILTHAGLIGLNGINENRIGLCVNTLMQLKAFSEGLPVAFIVRGLISKRNKREALHFLQSIPHASGQNYILGVGDEVFDFEASTNRVVQYDPKNKNGTVYHTNHPIVNDDVKSWFDPFKPKKKQKESNLVQSNSGKRFMAVEKRLASADHFDENSFKNVMRSRDDPNHPVCRTNLQNGRGFTFASVIFELGLNPQMHFIAGPPDEGEYQVLGFVDQQISSKGKLKQ